MQKTSIVHYLKSKTPRFLISQAEQIYTRIDPLLIQLYRLQRGWQKPIPPLELRKITSKRSIEDYIQSGERIANSLVENLAVTGKSIQDFRSILDFGCGAGRLIQYFYENCNTNPAVKLTGCDPNEKHIQWLSTEYPKAHFCVSSFEPPLSLTDQRFDLIYAISVFTHLSESVQFAWLQELKRTLQPGGIALLTIISEHAARDRDRRPFLKPDPVEPASIEKALAEEQFLFYVPDSYRTVNQLINPQSTSDEQMYGITWHSHEYIRKQWGQYFEVVAIVPGCIDSIQDLVILRN